MPGGNNKRADFISMDIKPKSKGALSGTVSKDLAKRAITKRETG